MPDQRQAFFKVLCELRFDFRLSEITLSVTPKRISVMPMSKLVVNRS